MAHLLDPYRPADSPVHRLDPRLKVVATLSFILSVVVLPDGAWDGFLLYWGLVLLCGRSAHIRPAYLLTRSLIALPFAAAALTVLFTLPGEPVLTIAGLNWTVTDAGLLRFSGILLRSWLSVQMAVVLTASTRFPDLVHALRHLRVPTPLVSVIAFMYRYLFVLADQAASMLQARAARSARLEHVRGGGSIPWRARTAGSMVGQLFLRSYERSDRVYNAMLARGYAGQLLTMNPHAMAGRDWAAGAIFLLFVAAIQAIARYTL